jgi:hypothetical protein
MWKHSPHISRQIKALRPSTFPRKLPIKNHEIRDTIYQNINQQANQFYFQGELPENTYVTTAKNKPINLFNIECGNS